jgi:hypothetical protein
MELLEALAVVAAECGHLLAAAQELMVKEIAEDQDMAAVTVEEAVERLRPAETLMVVTELISQRGVSQQM